MLQGRLYSIVQLVPRGSIIADIGTDHAYVPIHLVKENICPKVIATDISEGPLLQAKKNIKKNELQNKIETRLGPGLEPLKPNEVDIVIIAGIGGRNIVEIINDKRDVIDSLEFLILQPMTQQAELRYKLFETDYRIIDEIVVKDQNHFYEIIVVKKSKPSIRYDKIDILVGPVLRYKKDITTLKYHKFRKRKLLKIIEHVKQTNTLESQKALHHCEYELRLLEEVLK